METRKNTVAWEVTAKKYSACVCHPRFRPLVSASMMEGLDLFRKLVAGAKFDYDRFRSDAERLKVEISFEPFRSII